MNKHVNPTRLELGKLKKRLVIAQRGQKLLKDKQNELVRSFVSMARENARLRKSMEESLRSAMQSYAIASLSLPDDYLEEACLTQSGSMEAEIDSSHVLNIEIPNIHCVGQNEQVALRYGYLNTNAELDFAMEKYLSIFSDLLELSEIEKSCQLLSIEIEKTRRRVNALEYRTIPQLQASIREIQMKLEENERANITRLIKIKSFG